MAISTVDQLVAGFTGARQKLPISKAAVGNMTVGGNGSYWRSAGFPPPASIPSTPTTCTQYTMGSLTYNNPTVGLSTYLARLMLGSTVVGTIEVHDRLAHMGGLNTTLTTSQTVGIDLNALAGTDNIGQRKGRSDYATVQWWLEGYVQAGTSATTLFVSYTNHLGQQGSTSVSVLPNFRAGALLPIVPNPGDYIRSIDAIAFSLSTGTAGNVGITATIQRTEISCFTANVGTLYDWTALGLPPIYDNSCLMLIGNPSTTTLGALNGAVTLVQG